MLCRKSITEYFIEIIRTRIFIWIIAGSKSIDDILREQRITAFICDSFIPQLHIMRAVGDQIILSSQLLHTKITVIVDVHLFPFAFLRLDQDDAIGCTGAVDRSRCRIFKNRDRGNVTRIHVRHTSFHSVNEYHRIGIVQRAVATNTNCCTVGTRRTGVLAGPYAGYFSGKSLRRIRNRPVL